jgi:translation initiation factor 2B subunit (eIF-2B alpha/beta/delta family)
MFWRQKEGKLMAKKDLDIRKMLSDLKNDNTAGATELIFKALDILRRKLNLIEDPNENIEEKIIELIRKIINSRLSMASLISTMGYILQNSELLNKIAIEASINKFEKDWAERYKALEKNFQKFLNLYAESHFKLMLISYSSTIVNLLTTFNNYNLELYALESRPLFEGRRTAEILSKYFKIHLIVDAALGKFIDQIDMVLIGVDSILKDGSIINKIGTYPLVLVANANKKKVYAVCDSFKYNLRSHFGEPILIEEKPSNEIYNKDIINNFLEVHNYYFDITPSMYISGIISDLGILRVKDFLKKIQQDLPIEWFKYFLHNKKI